MEPVIADKKIKHTIYLDPTVSRQLKREKGDTDLSISEIVEASLSSRYQSRPRGERPAMATR